MITTANKIDGKWEFEDPILERVVKELPDKSPNWSGNDKAKLISINWLVTQNGRDILVFKYDVSNDKIHYRVMDYKVFENYKNKAPLSFTDKVEVRFHCFPADDLVFEALPKFVDAIDSADVYHFWSDSNMKYSDFNLKTYYDNIKLK
jgi:hypothetical protein